MHVKESSRILIKKKPYKKSHEIKPYKKNRKKEKKA